MVYQYLYMLTQQKSNNEFFTLQKHTEHQEQYSVPVMVKL